MTDNKTKAKVFLDNNIKVHLVFKKSSNGINHWENGFVKKIDDVSFLFDSVQKDLTTINKRVVFFSELEDDGIEQFRELK
jgi:hypothetical protein